MRSHLRCGAVGDSCGSTCSPNASMKARLLLADEVQVQLVPALLDVLLQPRGVLCRGRWRRARDCAHLLGATRPRR